MNHAFEGRLAAILPPTAWADVTLLVAVSGGADSVALFRAVHSLRTAGSGRIIVVHVNHRLRGAESDDDEALVRTLATEQNCTCLVHRALDPTVASEDDARRCRYAFFNQSARETGARYVLTAHTADDQAETILLRILRGTGLDGLAGIPLKRELLPGVALVRPLLTTTRFEVLGYLAEIDQPFRNDSTNSETRFTRNRVRNELIPMLERDYNPRVKESLTRIGQLAGESQRVIASAVLDLQKVSVKRARPRSATIECAALAAADPYLVRQLLMDVWKECGWGLRDMTWEHWRALGDLAVTVNSTRQRLTLPGGVQAECDGKQLRLVASPSH